MKRHTFLFGAITLVAAVATFTTAANSRTTPPPPIDNVSADMQELIDDLINAATTPIHLRDMRGAEEFDETKIFFEENATDGDLGIQFKVDGDAWRRVWIFDAEGRRFVNIRVGGKLRRIGLTEVQSESSEPSFDELPRDEFFELFPPGEYTMLGLTIENDILLSSATLTHDMPDQPVITAPMEDEEVDSTQPLVVQWQSVADPDAPNSVVVEYTVVVEKDEDDERNRDLTVIMLPGDTSFTVPVGFLEPGKDYKFELIVEESSGNRTISEVPFTTAE